MIEMYILLNSKTSRLNVVVEANQYINECGGII